MTTKDFQLLVANILSGQEEIFHILNSGNSLLISCIDESSFYINILESKRLFVHDDQGESFTKEYFATHSKEEFAKDILEITTSHPGFFLYFMIFSKLEEMQIIDSSLFYHIMDCIIHYEQEIDRFVTGVLSHYNIKDGESD